VPCGDLRAPPGWLTVPMHVSLGWSCFPHISTFVHRELFLELKGYDSNFMYSGDYDFFARALRHGSFTRIKRILTGHRHHGANPEHGPGSEALRGRQGNGGEVIARLRPRKNAARDGQVRR
jgi:GT2 family glycosyltransferase